MNLNNTLFPIVCYDSAPMKLYLRHERCGRTLKADENEYSLTSSCMKFTNTNQLDLLSQRWRF